MSQSGRSRSWTADEVRALGLTTDLPTAGSILGISEGQARQLERRGEFVVPILRLGKLKRVSVPALLRFLEADVPTT